MVTNNKGMVMEVFNLNPAVIPIAVPGGKSVDIDPYEAENLIRRTQSTDERWEYLSEYIAEKLGIEQDSLVHSQLVDFNDMVIHVVNELDDERKKKVGQIVFSLPATQGSQATTENGKIKKKTLGSLTSEKSQPGSRSKQTKETSTS